MGNRTYLHHFQFIIAAIALFPVVNGAWANEKGAAIYKKLCVECHGPHGEGVDGIDALYGNRSLDSLAGRIERTMPEDEEDLCVGDDAKAVADYIYHAFYSPQARARNQPVTTDLVRLTVPQYRTSVADLVGSFRGNPKPLPEERGLKARYFGERNFRGDKEKEGKDKFERVDPMVRFDFGNKTPDDENMSPEQFSIRWEGVLIAEETGTYEFIVRTRNGAQLWVNQRDDKQPQTIDAWVAKGNEVREETGSIFLLGGRAYPIRLDYFKYKEDKASIELMWKPPNGLKETIPRRVLAPLIENETMVVSTPFPADDRSYGYERGSGISRAWLDAVTHGSMETSEWVVQMLPKLAGYRTSDPLEKREERIRDFAKRFVEGAFRRPLTEDERKRYIEAFFKDTDDLEQAVKRCVMLTLTSPNFLYPDLPTGEAPDQYQVAARLALSLWDSVPDRPLYEAAKKDLLKTPQHIEAQARRMIKDPRTKAKMHGFFHHWLELDRAENMTKDSKRFPEFTPQVMADLRTSLDLFVESVVWSEKSDYRELLTSDKVFVNDRLAELYGVPKPKPGFHPVAINPGKRAGVVTHPYLLSTFAYHDNTSPIHRGVFLTRNIVGMTLKPPPEAIEFEDAKFDPKLTMREKVTDLTRAKACMACHSTINPLGFSLENYDAIGRWRTQEKNKPIDPKSDFLTGEGKTIKLAGARDVATFAANSKMSHQAFIRQLFHHTVKQPVAAYGAKTMDELQADFEASQFNIKELLLEIAMTAATGTPATGSAQQLADN